MSLLEVKDLKVRVEEREILHGLSLTVNPGEVHAIIGPNGSGTRQPRNSCYIRREVFNAVGNGFRYDYHELII